MQFVDDENRKMLRLILDKVPEFTVHKMCETIFDSVVDKYFEENPDVCGYDDILNLNKEVLTYILSIVLTQFEIKETSVITDRPIDNLGDSINEYMRRRQYE